jgi:Ni/Co efflux regulator RcnB
VSKKRPPRGPGAGPNHAFYKGGRLPSEYRSREYVVDHWQDHHLSRPPHGYHWVQTGADYVLAAIATGIIAQIVLSH